MNVSVVTDGSEVTLVVSGRVSSDTAPEFERAFADLPESAGDVVVDFSGLDYISSAGLRVLIGAEKRSIARGGTMRIVGSSETVLEVLEMTGLLDILTVEV